jgi:hypothetical protein
LDASDGHLSLAYHVKANQRANRGGSYPAGLLICLLLDNHSAIAHARPGASSTAISPAASNWTSRRPTHPGLNRVATFFSKTARSLLRHIRVSSKVEIEDPVQRYIESCNASPIVPKWSYGINRDPQLLAA